jgi:hypothetical protein
VSKKILGRGRGNILGVPYLYEPEAEELGEKVNQKLAAIASSLPDGAAVENSLQLDGYAVDKRKLELVALEGPVSVQAEEDALTAVLRRSGIPNAATVGQHIADANSLFVEGKYHPSLNESRSILQALIDDISVETDCSGGHAAKLPGGTANRIQYLAQVGFLTPEEQTAFGSAWGALSAGSHPGVPAREEARIGLILALEFGQLLLLKCENWSKNGYRRFSP